MKRVKIAIIDSGLDMDIVTRKCIVGGEAFYIKNSELYWSDDFQDKNGHGTQCAYIIHKHCPTAMLYIIKITHLRSGYSSSILLLEALKRLLEIDVDVINISLSVAGSSCKQEIDEVLKQLRHQKKTIVVAVKNGQQSSYPAEQEDCIGVRGVFMEHRKYQYDDTKPISVICNCIPEFVPDMHKKYEWFSGNSKDTAVISAEIGNIIQEYGKGQIEKKLKKYAQMQYSINTSWQDRKWGEMEEIVYKRLQPILYQYIKEYDGSREMVLMNSDTRRILDTYSFLRDCAQKLNIEIKYDEIQFVYLYSVESVVQYLSTHLTEN